MWIPWIYWRNYSCNLIRFSLNRSALLCQWLYCTFWLAEGRQQSLWGLNQLFGIIMNICTSVWSSICRDYYQQDSSPLPVRLYQLSYLLAGRELDILFCNICCHGMVSKGLLSFCLPGVHMLEWGVLRDFLYIDFGSQLNVCLS